jgi:hypothetical protein
MGTFRLWPILLAIAMAGLSSFAHGEQSIEKTFEFKRDKKSLFEGLSSSNTNTKVRSAVYLWANQADGRKAAEDVMEKDADPEVRRRIAQVLASKHKHPRAIIILRDSMRAAHIDTQSGASAFLMSAISLHNATGEKAGTPGALHILASSATGYSDVQGDAFAYAKKDSVRVLAASYLTDNVDSGSRKELRAAIKSYASDIVHGIEASSGQERKYWEMRLPTVLDIAIRGGFPDLVDEFASKAGLLENSYERERLDRVIRKAKEKK